MRLLIILTIVILLYIEEVLSQSLPQVSLNFEQSDIHGLVTNTRYANLLSSQSAFGFEIAFSPSEFRLGGTFAQIFHCHHLFKLTGEYLSQDNAYSFLSGTHLIWNDQYAFGGGYSYLLSQSRMQSINLSAYTSHSRDNSMPPIFHFGDNVSVLGREVVGADCFGVMMEFTLRPLLVTRINFNTYFDSAIYRNQTESPPNKIGIGLGGGVEQIFHPRIKAEIVAANRVMFNQYFGKLSWIPPIHSCNRLEVSVTAQYIMGNFPESTEKRFGVQLTYRWNLNVPNPTYLTPKSLQEDVLVATMDPVVRFPETLNARDQLIVP